MCTVFNAPDFVNSGEVRFANLTTIGGGGPLEGGHRGLAFTDTSTLIRVDMPALKTIANGDVFIESCNRLERVDMASLDSIPGRLALYYLGRGSDPAVYTNITFPALTAVGYDVDFDGVQLSGFSAPRLATVGLAWAKAKAAGGSGRLGVRTLIFPTASASKNIFALPAIKSVAGGVRFSNNNGATSLVGVDLPELGSVGESVQVESNSVLATFYLPKLGSVEQDVTVSTNAVLATVRLPKLGSVGQSVSVQSNGFLTAFDLPELESVGHSLSIESNYVLTAFNLPELGSVGQSLAVNYNSVLATFNPPKLGSVGQSLPFGNNNVLTAFSLPALKSVGKNGGGGISFNQGSQMVAIKFASLASVDGSMAFGNGLPRLQTLTLRTAGPVSVGGSFRMYGKEVNAEYAKPRFNCASVSGKISAQGAVSDTCGRCPSGCVCKGSCC